MLKALTKLQTRIATRDKGATAVDFLRAGHAWARRRP